MKPARAMRARFLLVVGLLVLVATPARSMVAESVVIDGLGFPRYPHAVTYSVFGANIAYIANGDLAHVVAWYRERSGRAWTAAPVTKSGRTSVAELSFTGERGDYRLHVESVGGPTVMISENLELGPVPAAASLARGLTLHGSIDPLGVPLYPHRIGGQSQVMTDGPRGLVTYGTQDSFDTVFAWFNTRLSSRFSLSYHVEGPEAHMQTFHRGDDLTVTITRRRQDGNVTVVGVESSR